MSNQSITLKEIKKAINKHNKEMNNDIKISLSKDGVTFSSVKAKKYLFDTNKEKPALFKEYKPKYNNTVLKEKKTKQSTLPFKKI